jgi:hypothetical protein
MPAGMVLTNSVKRRWTWHFLNGALTTMHLSAPACFPWQPGSRFLRVIIHSRLPSHPSHPPSTSGTQQADTIKSCSDCNPKTAHAHAQHVGEIAVDSRRRVGREMSACEELLKRTIDEEASRSNCSSWNHILWFAVRYVLRL